MRKKWTALCMVFVMLFALTGCGSLTKVVDLVTNNVNGKNSSETTKTNKTETEAGTKVIAAKDIKVGVLYIGSASDTSGYTYAHEQGIKTMANNLGLTSKQIVRKENVSDDNTKEKNKAIQECIDAGCNIIFGTSFGEMQELSEFAEKYPDIYFAHGSGYMSNGKNFTNYFGRIYQARYLSGIAAGLKTQSNKIGYVAALGNTNAEVTGGIDAFAMGVESVNTNATIYVKVLQKGLQPGDQAAPLLRPLFAAYDEQRVAHLLRDSLRVQPEDYEAMNVCLREQAQAAAEALLEQGMKLDGYLAWAAKQNVLLDTQAQEILDRLAEQQAQVNSAPEQNGPVLGGMSL